MKHLALTTQTDDGDGVAQIEETAAVNQNATAVNQNASTVVGIFVSLAAVPAPGTNYVPQYGAGAAINDATGPFTMPMPPRTVRCVLGIGGANPVNVTITGHVKGETDPGTELSETITCTGMGTYEGEIAFTRINSVETNVDPLGTLDVRTGNGFGVAITPDNGTHRAGAYEVMQIGYEPDYNIGVDGVGELPTVRDEITGTVVPVTAPDGVHVYTVPVLMQYIHTHTQNAHTHTQNSHSHAQDPHTHVVT